MSNVLQIPRINEKIRVKEVRLIDDGGKQLGIRPTTEALEMARNGNMDLVEVSPTANPPVCKIMDFGKYKYELNKKSKENKKRQKAVVTKEINMRPKIDGHDFETKVNHIKEFLADGCKVKVHVVFKGREVAYQDFGRRLLVKLAAEVKDIATIERDCMSEGRNLVSIFAPKPVEVEKKTEKKAVQASDAPPATATTPETKAPEVKAAENTPVHEAEVKKD